MKRIFQLAGLPTEADSDRIQFLALRKYTPAERASEPLLPYPAPPMLFPHAPRH